jgi:hypothetical protein
MAETVFLTQSLQLVAVMAQTLTTLGLLVVPVVVDTVT